MEDKDLLALFKILESEGVFETPEEMQSVIDTEGIEVLYDALPKGIFESIEGFVAAFPTVKKKRQFSTYWGGGSYGIRYRSGGATWLIGAFRNKQ